MVVYVISDPMFTLDRLVCSFYSTIFFFNYTLTPASLLPTPLLPAFLKAPTWSCVMSVPLSFLRSPAPPKQLALGRWVADRLAGSPHITTLLDCLCSTQNPAIFAPDSSRRVLTHEHLRSFISNFVLPHSPTHIPLGPNDRVLVALSNGPLNAVAILSIACYHTCAPVNASCTSSELREDVKRLGVKVIVSSKDFTERLELIALQEELGCDVVLLEAQPDSPAGLFDMACLGGSSIFPRQPSQLHNMDDLSLVLQTSGTSGQKKVVPYSLRVLVAGAWAVVHSWALRERDVNREYYCKPLVSDTVEAECIQ